MKAKLMTTAAAMFTFIAALVASSACVWGFYQPEEPESLR